MAVAAAGFTLLPGQGVAGASAGAAVVQTGPGYVSGEKPLLRCGRKCAWGPRWSRTFYEVEIHNINENKRRKEQHHRHDRHDRPVVVEAPPVVGEEPVADEEPVVDDKKRDDKKRDEDKWKWDKRDGGDGGGWKRDDWWPFRDDAEPDNTIVRDIYFDDDGEVITDEPNTYADDAYTVEPNTYGDDEYSGR
ncbi:hypothetical protein ACIBP6_26835 [Nonomuraea terrae]|uniref:hypothetical protein n=1 Tax=Nonomuraea terrae TaxID=2530383 RepID=UPI0037B8E4B2